MAVDKRRIEAVDQLWSAVTALGPAKGAALRLSVIAFDKAAPRARDDPKFRKLFQDLGGGIDITKIDMSAAAKARPFVPPLAWATFAALSSVLGLAAIRWQMLSSGAYLEDLADNETISKMLKAALPHQAEFIDKHGSLGHYLLLDELEAKLLQELRASLSGSDADLGNVAQAAEILRHAESLYNETKTQQLGLTSSSP